MHFATESRPLSSSNLIKHLHRWKKSSNLCSSKWKSKPLQQPQCLRRLLLPLPAP